MILTITPNAAVDKTYRVQGFALDRVNRPTESFTVAGGKGINVARVYQTLTGKAVVTGFLGGHNGAIIDAALAREGIRSECVQVDGESRLCIAVIDPSTGTQTEINESGPLVSHTATRHLTARVETLLSANQFDFLVMCGSLPPGAQDSLFAELITLGRRHSVRTVLDTSGAALRIGLEARPWMVKPNLAELASLFDVPLTIGESVTTAILEMHGKGVEVAVVTLGARGAIASVTDESFAGTIDESYLGTIRTVGNVTSTMWESTPPAIRFASAVASGDSFLAAFLWSWKQSSKVSGGRAGHSSRLEAALRLATGAGAANASEIGAGFCSRESILSAADKVQMRRIAPTF